MPPSKAKTSTSNRSRNPAAAAPAQAVPILADPDDKYAPTAWVSSGVGGTHDLTVPSGQTCLVKRPGLQGLMTEGVLRKIDSLSSLVDSKHVKGSKKRGASSQEEIDAKSVMKDPKALNDIMHTVDRVTAHCVIKPEVVMAPNDVTKRQPGVVYTDMVDLEDKMFIFNFVVGGVRDLETFRDQLSGDVGGLEAGEGVPESTE